jgi:hypothetical protein
MSTCGEVENLERETRVELATSTLARSRSTTELLPLKKPIINDPLQRSKPPRKISRPLVW